MDNLNNLLSSGGGIFLLILMIALSGLVIGALARWIMPGPDPMSIPKTILLGISGSFVGGIVAELFRLSPLMHPFWALLLQVGGALFVLWIVRRYRHRAVTP